MEKTMTRRSFLKSTAAGLAGLGLMGLGTAACADSEALYTPGSYTASAFGKYGMVSVTCTFDATRMTDLSIDASAETPNIGGLAAEKLREQILAAQGCAVDGISGATLTVDAIRQAVADCIHQASGGAITQTIVPAQEEKITVGADGDWLGTAPEIDESDIIETIETEVLVVGAGNAGLMTAARAAEGGAKVLVVEKTITSMNERHWIGAIGSTAAKKAGIEVSKQKVVAELCKYASHRCDERLIRQWAEHSGEMMDWYADVVTSCHEGVQLHMEWDVGEEGDENSVYFVPPMMHNFQDDLPEHDYSQATSAYGLSALSQYILEHGGEIRYELPMVRLEQKEGRVTGAIVGSEAKGYIRVNASKGVALCCGGYPYNKQMLAQLNPQAYVSTVEADASANDVGDGIRAAMWIGADKDPNPTAMLFDRGTIAPDQLSDGNWAKSGLFHLGSQPWLKVNLNGERFCNESCPYDYVLHAAYLEPGHLYNTIYDSSWMDQIAQFHQIGCARIIPSPSGGKLQIFSPEAEFGLLMAMEMAGFIQKADTLEELAEKLHMPADTFAATVERYNELCRKGVDEDFGKESYRMLPLETPPFYGCRQGASLLTTLDGLRINPAMQVLDKSGAPIPGLYAAGDCSGGFFANNYPEYIVGVAVGRTLTQGYILGEQLARA